MFTAEAETSLRYVGVKKRRHSIAGKEEKGLNSIAVNGTETFARGAERTIVVK
jgi:hypothetical protein